MVKVLSEWPHPTSQTPDYLQKEPEGMDEQLSVVFQVSKFKYVSLPDSFNYYFLRVLQEREKKGDLSEKITLGKGGERRGEH